MEIKEFSGKISVFPRSVMSIFECDKYNRKDALTYAASCGLDTKLYTSKKLIFVVVKGLNNDDWCEKYMPAEIVEFLKLESDAQFPTALPIDLLENKDDGDELVLELVKDDKCAKVVLTCDQKDSMFNDISFKEYYTNLVNLSNRF